MPTTCQVCGYESPSEARFCSQCGARLDGEGAIPAETRDQVMSSLRGEERLATVVFADMSESVRRTSGLSAEAATGLVNPLLQTMVELMVRYGGRIDRFLGDGILAVFGTPTVHEDDPIRAVWAALELRERASELGLPVTVGVNTGRVYFGPVGSSVHEELTVMGPTVNLAARFQSAAQAGEVVIGSTTAALVRAAFSLTPVTLTIKGLADPVEAFKAERLLDHPEKVRGIEDLRATMVGREVELDRLRAAYSTGGALAMIGDAGVGKSRLASELRAHVSSGSGDWFEGRCLEMTEDTAYGAFQDLFNRYLSSSHPLTALADSLQELVTEDALTQERVEEIAPFLAYVLGRRWGDRRDLEVTAAEPDIRHALTVDAVLTYLSARARLRPIVVFIEDMHWSDELSVDTVRRIRAANSPNLTLLLSSRPQSTWQERIEPPFEQLALHELTRSETQTLISGLLQVSGIPEALEAKILDRAQGNPFYVEELIRSLIQRGAITRHNGRWQVTAEDLALELPPSVEGVLMARFDRLPLPTRRAAKAAAVLGRSFDQDLFGGLAGPALVAELDHLVGAGILAPDGVGRYSFIHDLTRETIYANLLPSQQAELHEMAAGVLEGRPRPDVDQLAHHYQRSSNHQKAVEYLFKAGEQALDAYTNDVALRYLDDGLERVTMLPEPDQAPWRCRLHARLGELLGRMGQHSKARATLESALAEMDPDPLDTARTWRHLGQMHRLEGHFEDAHRCFDHAEKVVAQAGDDPAAKSAWIDVQKERSLALYFGGRGRDLTDHNRNVEPVVERYGSAAQRADFLFGRLLHDFVASRFVVGAETVATARRALELAEEGADPGRAAESRFVLGFALLWADQSEEAAATLEAAVAANERVGAVMEQCRARAYLSIALRRLGRVDEADACAREALANADELANDYYRGHAKAVQCWVAWKRGSDACDGLGAEAYDAWGWHEDDGHRGLDCEFAWLAVWPRAVAAYERGDPSSAVGHLELLLVPWERPMPSDLQNALSDVVASSDPDQLPQLFELAQEHASL